MMAPTWPAVTPPQNPSIPMASSQQVRMILKITLRFRMCLSAGIMAGILPKIKGLGQI